MTVIGGALAAAIAAPAIAQEVVVTGPPPELRTHLDAFMKAFNSANDDDWEAMAKTVFTPEFLKKQTPAERKKAVAAMRAQFGKIHIQQVDRRGGPDAPLQVTVAGTVASGSIWIDLDDSSRFDSLKAEVKKLNERRRH
jgi:hypothetical protein